LWRFGRINREVNGYGIEYAPWRDDERPAMQERRRQDRRRALKAARIIFNTRFSALDCTVRNLSADGAMLLVAGPHGVPDRFILELDAGAVAKPCRVIWRKEKQIGVSFG
jgi:hypothetical protein